MSQNVKFFFTSTKSKFDALVEKNPLALYFITDEATGCNYLYKGDKLIAAGHEASEQYAGLMSAADKAKLDMLDVYIPEYTIEKQEVADDGYSVSYKLKKTVNGKSTFVGDAINIAKDMVLQNATLETVTEKDVPYVGAVVGDPYIDMAFNDAESTHIYVPVSGLVDTYIAGDGIQIVDGEVSVKIADDSNGLTSVDGSLSIDLATENSAGAMSAIDKAFINAAPDIFASKNMTVNTCEQVKYEISTKPEGTLVNYSDHEIRVMCPVDTKWTKQNVGVTGNANMYYMGFKAYAPEGAVSFKEGDRGVIIDEMFGFDDDFAGTDEFGRNYSICWLALASYDEKTDSWTYFGKNSSVEKYIGWDYCVEWFDSNGVKIAADQIRINLSNESCHNNSVPSYMNKYATIEQIAKFEEILTWNEIIEF